MTAQPVLQPTLWRTCRVLANRARLRILGILMQHPGQTVSQVARRLEMALPVTSQYLRALEARGLLTVHRSGLRVMYRIADTTPQGSAHRLTAALRLVFERESTPVESLFKVATAFTHPRRIEVFRTLKQEARTFEQLQTATGISVRALVRHVNKLEARGFVVSTRGRYRAVSSSDPVGRELARLASE
jgi:DNA-binding transcriptional ArsR family regulator